MLKIDNLPISGFLPRGNEGVTSPWPPELEQCALGQTYTHASIGKKVN
jgi:hypothetical protein